MNLQVTLGNLIVLVGALIGMGGTVGTILLALRKARIDSELRDDAKTDAILTEVRGNRERSENRLAVIDTTLVGFVPRPEIEGGFKNEATARAAAIGVVNMDVQRNAEAITKLRIDQGKIEQRIETAEAGVSRLEALMKENHRDTKEDIAGIQRCLNELSRKIG